MEKVTNLKCNQLTNLPNEADMTKITIFIKLTVELLLLMPKMKGSVLAVV